MPQHFVYRIKLEGTVYVPVRLRTVLLGWWSEDNKFGEDKFVPELFFRGQDVVRFTRLKTRFLSYLPCVLDTRLKYVTQTTVPNISFVMVQ